MGADPLDVLADLLRVLRRNRGKPQTADGARRLLEALQGAQAACEAAGERFGAVYLTELVEDAQRTVTALEARDAERQAEERQRFLAAVCSLDDHASHLDGGPSDYGVRDFLADVEAWGRERTR